MGQNGILSQTRRLQDTMATSTDDNDFSMTMHSDQILSEELSKNPMINPSDDVFFNTMEGESSLGDALTIIEDVQAMHEAQMLENHDVDEALFKTLDAICEKHDVSDCHKNHHPSVSYPDGIEDISNDGIDSGPAKSVLTADEELLSSVER